MRGGALSFCNHQREISVPWPLFHRHGADSRRRDPRVDFSSGIVDFPSSVTPLHGAGLQDTFSAIPW